MKGRGLFTGEKGRKTHGRQSSPALEIGDWRGRERDLPCFVNNEINTYNSYIFNFQNITIKIEFE